MISKHKLTHFIYSKIHIFSYYTELLETIILCVLYCSNFVNKFVNMFIAHKFEVKTWNGIGDFSLWHQKMRALLLQQRCASALHGTQDTEISAYWRQKLDKIAWSSIFLHLSNSVIRKVGETTTAQTLQAELETIYLTKNMPNKCYLPRQFYNFRFNLSCSLEGKN